MTADKLVKTDYDFFKKSLLESGIKESDFNEFEKEYIISNNARENIISKIK